MLENKFDDLPEENIEETIKTEDSVEPLKVTWNYDNAPKGRIRKFHTEHPKVIPRIASGVGFFAGLYLLYHTMKHAPESVKEVGWSIKNDFHQLFKAKILSEETYSTQSEESYRAKIEIESSDLINNNNGAERFVGDNTADTTIPDLENTMCHVEDISHGQTVDNALNNSVYEHNGLHAVKGGPEYITIEGSPEYIKGVDQKFNPGDAVFIKDQGILAYRPTTVEHAPSSSAMLKYRAKQVGCVALMLSGLIGKGIKFAYDSHKFNKTLKAQRKAE